MKTAGIAGSFHFYIIMILIVLSTKDHQIKHPHQHISTLTH